MSKKVKVGQQNTQLANVVVVIRYIPNPYTVTGTWKGPRVGAGIRPISFLRMVSGSVGLNATGQVWQLRTALSDTT